MKTILKNKDHEIIMHDADEYGMYEVTFEASMFERIHFYLTKEDIIEIVNKFSGTIK